MSIFGRVGGVWGWRKRCFPPGALRFSASRLSAPLEPTLPQSGVGANPQMDLGSMRPSLAHASKRRRTVAVDLGATPGRRADSGPRPRSRPPRPGSRRRRPGSRAGSTQVRVTRTWVEPASASGRPSLDPGRDFNSRGPPLIYVCMYWRK